MKRKREDDALLEVEDHLKNPYIPYTSDFLDERLQVLLERRLKLSGREYLFDGGYPEAVRKILILKRENASDGDTPPIAALIFEKPCKLSHRNVLGTLISLGVDRDVIGDISIWEDKIQIIVHERMLEYLKNNFTHINGRRIKVKTLPYPEIIPFEPEFDEYASTLASNRLDAAVSRIFGISRDKAARAIRQGLITHNYLPAEKVSTEVRVGDKISMRKKGKAEISEIGGYTKKGRLRFKYLKYK